MSETSTPETPTPPSGYFSWIPTVEQLTRWAQGVKSAAVTLLAVGTASIGSIGVINAVRSDSVTLEAIKVPSSFEDRGFTSEITTTRLLDEVAAYERMSSSAKDRVSINGKDDLAKLQAPVGGVDIRSVQGVIQDALGVKKERITGEITFKKIEGEIFHNVRMRRVPGNRVVLDITVKGDPEDVLKQTGMAMLESFDPAIAAGVYWRKGDEDKALRMIDVVLGNDSMQDDKYSLNLRCYIHITHKRFDQAKRDIDRILKIDPKFAPAYSSTAWLYRAQGKFDESLQAADKTIELAAFKPWGYYTKALTLREAKRNDEAEVMFRKALSLKLDAAPQFVQTARFMTARGKDEDAGDIYKKGLFAYPDHAGLHAYYGTWLQTQGFNEAAAREFTTALQLEPKNQVALAGKAELDQAMKTAEKDGA